MKFGIDKHAVLELERVRPIRSEGIEFPDGERMEELDQERYNSARKDHEQGNEGNHWK